MDIVYGLRNCIKFLFFKVNISVYLHRGLTKPHFHIVPKCSALKELSNGLSIHVFSKSKKDQDIKIITQKCVHPGMCVYLNSVQEIKIELIKTISLHPHFSYKLIYLGHFWT